MKTFSKFTPNLHFSQALTSLFAHLQNKNQASKFTKQARKKLAKQFNVTTSEVTLTYGARSAFYTLLAELVKKNPTKKEVILCGFTCRVLINPILKLGLKPIFIDLAPDTLRMSVEQIHQKISKNTLAIVVQHTFGALEDISTIKTIHKNIPLIADNAHFLPNKEELLNQKKYFNAAIFSFGTNKILSASNLGALVDYKSKDLPNYSRNLKTLPNSVVHKQLLKNWLFTFSMPIYDFLNIGKGIMFLASHLKLTLPVVSMSEKQLDYKNVEYYKAPKKLGITLLHALKFYQKQITHRVLIKSIYQANLDSKFQFDKFFSKALIFYPIQVNQPTKLAKYLNKHGFQVNLDWTNNILVPDSQKKPSGFKEANFPNSKKVADHLVLLPLNKTISPSKAVDLCSLIKQYEN